MFFDCVRCLNGKAWHLFQNIAEVDNRKLEILLLLSLKWNLIFSLLSRCFYFPLSPTRRLPDLYIWVTRWNIMRNRNCLPVASIRIFVGSELLTILVFCAFCFVYLRSVSCAQCCSVSGLSISDLPLHCTLFLNTFFF